MSERHGRLRERLGPAGVWTFAFDELRARDVREEARAIESLGYPAMWVPEGSSSRDVFAHLGLLLASTDRMTVCSGIANITARAPEVMAAGMRTLADAYPGRVVGGIGIGHEYSTRARGIGWEKPLARMRAYLDRMDAAASVPVDEDPTRLLAALGDGMLRLSAERSLGAHTYFVPVAHTARAREVLGPEPVLAVELGVVVGPSREAGLAAARDWARHYLELPNYANNLRRMGFADEDLESGGSEALLDATFAFGDAQAVARRVQEHRAAGADHVCVQVVGSVGAGGEAAVLRELAPALLAG